MIAAAITRRLNVDPLMRTTLGCVSVDGTCHSVFRPYSVANKIAQWRKHLQPPRTIVRGRYATDGRRLLLTSVIYLPSIQVELCQTSLQPYAKLTSGRRQLSAPSRCS